MRQANIREDRLKKFSNVHKDLLFGQPESFHDFPDKKPPSAGFQDPFISRPIVSSGPDTALNKQSLHAAVKESLFNNMKPLKAQIEQKEQVGETKTGLSERERRLMLREMERKKRLAGIGGDANSSYGKIAETFSNSQRDQEAEKENKAGGNFAVRVGSAEQEWKKPDESSNAQFFAEFSQAKPVSEPAATPPQPLVFSSATPNEFKPEFYRPPTEDHPKPPPSSHIMDQAYERERQKKERERELLRNEYLQAQSKGLPRAQRAEASSTETNATGLLLGTSNPAEEKRKKQLQYREQLESQLKAKQTKAADEVFSQVSRRPPIDRSVPPTETYEPPKIDTEKELERRKKEAYANELREQIELKKQRAAHPQSATRAISRGSIGSAYKPEYVVDQKPEQYQMQVPQFVEAPAKNYEPVEAMQGENTEAIERRKKEEYRRYLESQMNEQKERKKVRTVEVVEQPAPLPKQNAVNLEVDMERMRKLQAQQHMQEELKKQMEEKERRKMIEKQRLKEEEEREEARFKKEQEEIARKLEMEKAGERNNSGKVNWAVEQKRKLFQPSADNPISRVGPAIIPHPFPEKVPPEQPKEDDEPPKYVQLPNYQAEPAVPMENTNPFVRQTSYPTEENVENPFRRLPSEAAFAPPVINPMFRADTASENNSSNERLLEQYQKQVEELKSEKQLAREEALIYKEQLIRERELRIQQMMEKLQQNQAAYSPPVAMPPEPIVPPMAPQPHRIQSRETFRDAVEELPDEGQTHKADDNVYMTQLMKSEMKYSEPPAADFDLEESLASDTKFVRVAEDPKALNDLYKTWGKEQFEEVRNRLAEVSIQTSIALERAEKHKAEIETGKVKEAKLDQKAIEEEEIEEDYSQADEGSDEEKYMPKHIPHKENEAIMNAELADTVKVESMAQEVYQSSPVKKPVAGVVSPKIAPNLKFTDLKMARLHRAKGQTKNAATKMIEALQRDIAEVSQVSKTSLVASKSEQPQETERKKWELPPVYKVDENNDLVEDFKIIEEPRNGDNN